MNQSGGAKNSFFLVTFYNFQKRGWAIALMINLSTSAVPEVVIGRENLN